MRFSLSKLLSLFFLGAAFPAFGAEKPEPSFAYDLKVEPEGYVLGIQMSFSPDVALGRVVANLKNGALLHEFNPNVDPIETRELEGSSYESILSWKTFGLRSSMLSRCEETEGERSWSRRCEVDVSKLGAGRFTDWKRDEIRCQGGNGAPVRCELDVRGRIKSVLFLKSSVLTLKAKAQALVNWGKFWYLSENGSVSTRLSNPLFDRSALKSEIDALVNRELPRAKEFASDFRFHARASFRDPGSR